jgi:PKD repeat protein
MEKKKYIIVTLFSLIIITSILTLIKVSASDALPYWGCAEQGEYRTWCKDYEDGNFLYNDLLDGGPIFIRNDGTTDEKWLGSYRYPTIYQGRFGGGAETNDNTTFNVPGIGQVRAYGGQPFYHLIAYEPPVTMTDYPFLTSPARNVIETHRLNADTVKNRYGGNPDWVLDNLEKYDITKKNPTTTNGGSFGKFYWIQDIAQLSGGYAQNVNDPSFDVINGTRLIMVRTSWPDIITFSSPTTPKQVNSPITFNVKGYEYVSLNRNRVTWDLQVTKDGQTVATKTGTFYSTKGNKNPNKANEYEAGYFDDSSIQWTPTEAGSYYATVTINDQVRRYATKATSVTVKPVGVEQLEITPSSASILKGTTQQYRATYTNISGVQTDVTTDVANTTWSTSNTSIATIGSKTGLATGVNAGNTKINVTYKALQASADIEVYNDIPPPPKPNMPPVAEVSTEAYYYWPELVNISTVGYDPDGELASEFITVNGESSGKEWSSPRVMERVTNYVSYLVTDSNGATAEDRTSFDILPTFPKAETEISGSLKQNRAVLIDAKASDRVSPVHVAPIDYSKTKWAIKPLSQGLTLADIKIRQSTDPSIRQLLFKKPGKYELTLTVTNKYGEESEVHTRILEIRPDEQPYARFTVDKSIYTRDAAVGKQVSITLTDGSVSLDGDVINKRIWYVEFDANNDGYFGTPADGGKQVISNNNLTQVVYKTNHVGHYRFSIEVQEKFGEPTYEEFIQPIEYLVDKSDVLDSSNRISEYMKVENFNLPNYDKAILVDNVPPVIDFGVKRMNSLEVVLDFGGMVQATLDYKTGSRPGGGINNGGGGGNYNHYYYNIDENYKNALTAYASGLETDLRMKGLNATVKINNCYYQVLDIDGECVTNVPVWGWEDYGSYSYSSYSGTSPYSGSWEVTSSSSTPIYSYDSYSGTSPYSGSWEVTSSSSSPIYQYRVTGCVNPKDGSWHNPPCVIAANEVWGNVQVGTQYSASLRKHTSTQYSASLRRWESDYRFVITNYVNQGCGPDNRPGHPTTDPTAIDQKIDTTDFTQGFNDYTFSNVNNKFYFRMDRNKWTWPSNMSKRDLVTNKIRSQNVYFWSNADNSVRLDAQTLINSKGVEGGNYTQYSTEYLQSNIQRLKDYLLNRYMIEENPESFTIVLGDRLDYTTQYSDFEMDHEYQREWKFVHDPTSINGRVIDNQPSGLISQSGYYLTAPMQLTEVGTYKVTLRAKDNPLSDVGNDSRFNNFRKWSDTEIVREFKIHAHRRPIADFSFNVAAGALALTLDPSLSYDPDHQFNRTDKGIVEYTWEKYVVDGVEYSSKPPVNLAAMKDYLVTLRVKDIDGAYGYVTKIISTKNVNLKPVALFDAPNLVLVDGSLNIKDRSYDPNGDSLTNYSITLKRASDGVVLWTGSTFPTSFSSIGIGTGTYIMGLTVDDVPKYPPSLRSDLYEKTIQVIQNRAPNSCFELSRTTISVASVLCADGSTSPYTLLVDEPVIYTDKSSDPDNHPLINYSWNIEKLSHLNEVIETWNIGSPPTDFSAYGVGKFRVTQMVFDSPPSPLPSLSGKLSKIFNVVKGPQNPYAMFEYQPLIPIQGNTIGLTDLSWDEDGTVTQWQWTIQAPNGTITTQVAQNPIIANAQVGIYKVSLHVWDNTSLRSKNPAYKEIVVSPAPPNSPPIALFVWEPFSPFVGNTITLNPDSSFDPDGTIVSYQWQIRSKEGSVINSSNRYPSFVASSEYYDVTLTVRDNKGVTASLTQRITVNVAKLVPLVTHTDEWKNYWVEQGMDANVNKFLAGEKFVIRLVTSPANRVEGTVNLPGKIGQITIPSTSFQLISTGAYEYIWEATFWREDFIDIPKGEYIFNFKGYHPTNNPTVTSNNFYFIEIVGSVYRRLNYHQRF